VTEQQFQIQMNHLSENFGKAAYGTERVRLLWREVGSFSAAWFEGVVSKMIGESRYAPLLPEFREACAKEREKNWVAEKRENESDAKAYWMSSYHPDDVKALCTAIKRRAIGAMSDQDWEAFMRGLNAVAESKGTVLR